VINAPRSTLDYGFLPEMDRAIGAAKSCSSRRLTHHRRLRCLPDPLPLNPELRLPAATDLGTGFGDRFKVHQEELRVVEERGRQEDETAELRGNATTSSCP
jgi:hypothetical protein